MEKVPIILGPIPPPIGTYSTLKLCGTNSTLKKVGPIPPFQLGPSPPLTLGPIPQKKLGLIPFYQKMWSDYKKANRYSFQYQ